MEVYNLYINYYSKTNVEPEEFKLVGINDTKCINVKVNQNNETCYFAYNTKNSIEYSIFYEILNESPLWNYSWIVKLISSNIFRFEIIITLDTLLINDFISFYYLIPEILLFLIVPYTLFHYFCFQLPIIFK